MPHNIGTYFYLVCFLVEETNVCVEGWERVCVCVWCGYIWAYMCVFLGVDHSYFHPFLISFDSQLS